MTKTVATLLGLALTAPLNAAVTLLALLRRRPPRPAPSGRTVMLSGGKMTKALALARAFHRDGHRVVLVEAPRYRFTGHRFSRAVDRFDTVPPPTDPGYADALVAVARREGADVYVPVCAPASSVPDADAKAALSAVCEVVHPGPELVRRLDDKHAFARAAAELGLRVPDTHLITDPEQVVAFDFTGRPRPYVLKSIPYDPVRRLDLTPLPRPTAAETAAFARSLPISEQTPWILQEFIAGQEYCTHSTVRDGRVRLHCCCESSAFQLNYAQTDQPDVDDWVRTFVGGLAVTGQVSIDFIRADDDGQVYAIECNPRTHSAITMFYDHPGVAAAYLTDGDEELRPLPSSRATHWTYWELWRAISEPRTAPRRLRTLLTGRDAIFDPDDPLPFLLVHHLQIPSLLVGNLLARRPWIRVDFNIGKLIEPAGD